ISFLILPLLMCCLTCFFQAEDGIRDDLVTGVQTCALPISGQAGADMSGLIAEEIMILGFAEQIVMELGIGEKRCLVVRAGQANRSEERRVGKECKWSGDQE